MLPIVPVTVGGGLLATGTALLNRRKSSSLVQVLSTQKQTTAGHQLKSAIQKYTAPVATELAAMEEGYQRFVQRRIDPWLGQTRHAQLQDILSEEALVLSRDERYANQRFGLGMLTLSLSHLGSMALYTAHSGSHFAWLFCHLGQLSACVYAMEADQAFRDNSPCLYLPGHALAGRLCHHRCVGRCPHGRWLQDQGDD